MVSAKKRTKAKKSRSSNPCSSGRKYVWKGRTYTNKQARVGLAGPVNRKKAGG